MSLLVLPKAWEAEALLALCLHQTGSDQKLNDGERDDLFKQYAAIAEKERQRPIKTSAQIGGSAGATAERSKGSSTGSEGDDSFKCPVRGVKVQAQFKESYMSGKQFAKEAKLMAAKKAANGLSAKKVAEVEAAYGVDFWSKWQADAGRSRTATPASVRS